MASKRPRYTLHRGHRLPLGFPTECFDSALQLQARRGDLFITTYPKCGTTWAQHIVYLISHRGEPLPAGQSMNAAIPHLEELGLQAVEQLPEPRCIKTHLPLSLTPIASNARYLYVARNPFDCAVSFFHHSRGFGRHYDFEDGLWDDYFPYFLAGEVDSDDYFDHLVPWFERRDHDNVLLLTFESMKTDPRRAVLTIGQFMGAAGRAVVENPVLLEKILHHSSFDAMSKDQERWSSQRPANMPAFVRKGQIGDWANHFSPDQTQKLLDRFAERTQGTTIESLWPEILRAARHYAASGS